MAKDILSHATENAKLIYAGKTGGSHSMPQEEITKLLIKEAKGKEKIVVRLKGGDPFIFGRGGEEALALAKEGIPFEVVPGITSASAVPAYWGIPVTHRGVASAVAFVTGHEDPKKGEESVDWDYLSRFPGTLVILMGIGRIRDNVDRLISFGRSPDTPTAVICRGTTPFQRGVFGRLSEIADLVEDAGIVAPAIIVIGDVVNFRDVLAWYEKLPLFGKRIMVTRARHQAGELSVILRELGAEPIELPTIEIRPPSDLKPVKNAIDRILDRSAYDVLVFTSPNGVETFFDYLIERYFDSRALSQLTICAIGPGTKSKLADYGIIPDIVPERYISEDLASAIIDYLGKTKGGISGKNILLFRAEGARKLLAERLGEAGAMVDDISAYRSIIPDVEKEKLLEAISLSDLITFASSSAAMNLKDLLEINGIVNREGGTKIPPTVAIGPITANTARESGFDVVAEASEYTVPGLVSTLVKYFGEAHKE